MADEIIGVVSQKNNTEFKIYKSKGTMVNDDQAILSDRVPQLIIKVTSTSTYIEISYTRMQTKRVMPYIIEVIKKHLQPVNEN